jgi:DtxR family Mn-dependent transcriptional regulator
MEQYLEVIGRLEHREEGVRVKDIASEMDVTMPSVTVALKTLEAEGLVTHSPYARVWLTAAGRAVAQQIQRRHDALFRFLSQVLYVPVHEAERDACEMEHGVGAYTLERLTEFVEFVRACPYVGRRHSMRLHVHSG